MASECGMVLYHLASHSLNIEALGTCQPSHRHDYGSPLRIKLRRPWRHMKTFGLPRLPAAPLSQLKPFHPLIVTATSRAPPNLIKPGLRISCTAAGNIPPRKLKWVDAIVNETHAMPSQPELCCFRVLATTLILSALIATGRWNVEDET
jgi:hypothetical protein